MKDLTEGKLNETLAIAKEKGNTTLDDCLNRLKTAEENLGVETFVSTDFAPLSFYFVRKDKDGNFRGNGGIIFHGNHDKGGNGSAPTFSVSLDNSTEERWEIHT